MGTETRSPRLTGLDLWPDRDLLDTLVEGQMAAVAAVRAIIPDLERIAGPAAARLQAGGRLVYIGAGTSARLAVQDGVELTPTFDWPPERLVFLIAGGTAALTRAVEGAEDDAAAGAAAVAAAGVGASDVAIALAASGRTPYTVAALDEARRRGALTVGVANNPDTPLLVAAEHPVRLETGPEAIAGSTRMKAGTAQRVLLTVLSSLLMVRLGRVHDGYMVDLRATSRKLERRAVAMVSAITGADAEAAAAALDRCGGRVKPAILLLSGEADPEAAVRRLDRHAGRLRPALASLKDGEGP
ncbi:MAG: N-acetylmuramic acid 6-phosphate etherase [Alphaproteobacteria bacterium]|jgi:N-acetylmuramic acid 6-phosphate etherase|nr:N-acetylmuramic acid 6-phosphate etherase [Alphaproteobacteria bacterium]